MTKWQDFEGECVNYLRITYEKLFIRKGDSNPNDPDIVFIHNGITHAIEVKMPHAQCGQFVVAKDKDSFYFSPKNKSPIFESTQQIIAFMNQNFAKFSSESPSTKPVLLDASILESWVISYYMHKKVAFFITKTEDNRMIIFPTQRIANYFHITANYRAKKSGSRKASKRDLAKFRQALSRYPQYNLTIHSDCSVTSDTPIHALYLPYDETTTFFLNSPDKRGHYPIRKLSHTNNKNVIFSLDLKENAIQDPDDLNGFETSLGLTRLV